MINKLKIIAKSLIDKKEYEVYRFVKDKWIEIIKSENEKEKITGDDVKKFVLRIR